MDSYQYPCGAGRSASSDAQRSADAGTPVIPLPNPGEGGPVYPGDEGGVPVIPLPNPGEGGPVYPGDEGGVPVIPLPNPGEGGPVYPGDEGGVPVIPLPNPGEGGPVAPGPIFPSRPGQTIIITPGVHPCFFCPSGVAYGAVRFLNSAHGYPAFSIFINGRMATSGLMFASITGYGRIAAGFQTVTVAGPDGYIYVQRSLPFRPDQQLTVAVIRTLSGLDLLQIVDEPCGQPRNVSCIRASNLAYNAPDMDVLLNDGRVVFSDVTYKETTAFKRIRPGNYLFYLSPTSLSAAARDVDIETLGSPSQRIQQISPLVCFDVRVRRNYSYTIFIMNYENDPSAIRTMIVEDSAG